MSTSILRSIVRIALDRLGYVAVPKDEWHHIRTMRSVHKADVVEIEELYRHFVFPDLPRASGRADALHELHGTTVGEAVYIVHHLHRALAAPGDVCEFGCNEGATSRLLAHELLEHPDRTLWLFDSFEGLPPPSEKDRLIDDIAGLGSIAAYRGQMRAAEDQVRDKLAKVPFPTERTRLIKSRAGSTRLSRGPMCLPRSVSLMSISTSTSRSGTRCSSSIA
ncbi:MAG: TylF/MycF/NovP-related O-methyltransferase [Acetobacteraceae bacterium]